MTALIAAWLAALAVFCFARRNAHDVNLPWAPLTEVLKHIRHQRGEGQVRGGFQTTHNGSLPHD